MPIGLLKAARRAARRAGDSVLGAGNGRVPALLLRAHFRARYRLEWRWSHHPPHFWDFRLQLAELMTGQGSAASMTRFFLAREVIRQGDIVLDIGCGDGFADRAFYADRAAAIDAIDIEPDAIAMARSNSSATNLRFHRLDATRDPFPSALYDVIIWDGAIGHFPPEAISSMLEKIRQALKPDGVFVGSESLERIENCDDHLVFFDTLDVLRSTLSSSFPNVAVRETTYRIADGITRREGYWRCSLDPSRLKSDWFPPN